MYMLSHGNQFSKYNIMKQVLFVGDAVLGVPKSRFYSPFWADEGVRPYKLIFLINKIEFRDVIGKSIEIHSEVCYNSIE